MILKICTTTRRVLVACLTDYVTADSTQFVLKRTVNNDKISEGTESEFLLYSTNSHSPVIPIVFHFSNGTWYYVPYAQEDSHFLKMSPKWMFVIHYLLYGIMANEYPPHQRSPIWLTEKSPLLRFVSRYNTNVFRKCLAFGQRAWADESRVVWHGSLSCNPKREC
jgi:hypothetical protein